MIQLKESDHLEKLFTVGFKSFSVSETSACRRFYGMQKGDSKSVCLFVGCVLLGICSE